MYKPAEPAEPMVLSHNKPAAWRRVLLTTASALAAAALIVSGSAALIHPPVALASLDDRALGGNQGCPPTRSASLVRGNGPGGHTNGPDTILAYEYAIYQQRSAHLARDLAAADAPVSTAVIRAQIQVQATPVGTQHCVTITPLSGRDAGTDRFAVWVAETRPDRSPLNYAQVMTTASYDDGVGTTVITRIGDKP